VQVEWAARLPQFLKVLLEPAWPKPEATERPIQIVVRQAGIPPVDTSEVAAALAAKVELAVQVAARASEEAVTAEIIRETVAAAEEVVAPEIVQETVSKTEEASKVVSATEEELWTEEVRLEYATNCQDAVFCCRPYPLNPGVKGHIYLNKNKSPLGNGRDISMIGAFNSWKVSAT